MTSRSAGRAGRLVSTLAGAAWALALAGAPAGAEGAAPAARAAAAARWPVKFPLAESGLVLRRAFQPNAFYDVVGRRAGAFGYEGRGLEAWAWPLKLADDFQLAFRIEGYPLAVEARDCVTDVEVRPEATTFTYSHAGFTVRQVVFAPLHEPAVVMLLEVQSVLPLQVIGSFRPRLRLMWPAGLMTGNLAWDEQRRLYLVTEETRRFAALVGAPGARDLAVMPYQEEPRDVPIRFEVDVHPADGAARFVPIVIAGSVRGRDDVLALYERVLASTQELFTATAAHYRTLLDSGTRVELPDPRLQAAYNWARVGLDKGLVDNPLLGSGLVAGFRTSGDSERPGFAWLFGRDALWSAFALHPAGDVGTARVALDFLRQNQRWDGKVPHEISQSASLVPWFQDYPYPWNSADATPLYVIAEADFFRWTGDRAQLDAAWDAIVRAWRFSAGTDRDGNGLVENTAFGHGWVEGGDLYPAHEEIYQQGVWIEACRALAELAEVRGEEALAAEAHTWAERTLAAVERTFWLGERGFYAFGTKRPWSVARAQAEANDEPAKPPEAERGPSRERRQARLDELRESSLYDEDTVLPAVPMWWGQLDPLRAQAQVDQLGSGELATDWGARLLSRRSRLYDPLSYHHGSVWPLFTGWAAMAAYRYGRPHVGYQALTATALLTEPGALGYVTELLSGDFNAPFGRSSHHQVWSEAMVVTPLLRGLFGLEALDGGRALRVAPQWPAGWERAALRGVSVGGARYDVVFERAAGDAVARAVRAAPKTPQAPTEAPAPAGASGDTPAAQATEETPAGTAPAEARPAGRLTVRLARRAGPALRLAVAPAFPLDARLRAVSVDGRAVEPRVTALGDVQRAEVAVDAAAGGDAAETTVVFEYDAGTDVFVPIDAPAAGAASRGLRVLRSRPDDAVLHLVLEGRGGDRHTLHVHTARALSAGSPAPPGVTVTPAGPGRYDVTVAFEGSADVYVRREITLPLR